MKRYLSLKFLGLSTFSLFLFQKYFRMDSMDKIVSPVVPQPGAWKRPPRTTASGARKSQRRSTSQSESTPADLSPLEENGKSLVEGKTAYKAKLFHFL